MKYGRIDVSQLDALWALQLLYKEAIGEEKPDEENRKQLAGAMTNGQILFYGAFQDGELIGCCSVTVGFSTFDYQPSGVFEDFYVLPAFRHQGVARALVKTAYRESGISSMTVGCADCDAPMYQALGFSVPLGHLWAYAPS